MKQKFDEEKVSGIWLQLDTYNNDGICIIKEFQVPMWWLKQQIEEEYKTVRNFLEEYTSDESNDIYCKALLDGKVLIEIES